MDIAIVSVIASSLTAIVSVVSGVIVAKMNNKNQLKVKKFELLNQDKKQTFQDYIMILNKLIYITIDHNNVRPDNEAFVKWEEDYFGKFSAALLFATDSDLKKQVIEMDKCMWKFVSDYIENDNSRHEEYIKAYEEKIMRLIELLSKDLTKL